MSIVGLTSKTGSRSKRRVFASVMLVVAIGLTGSIPASAAVNPTFSSNFTMSYNIYGVTYYKQTSGNTLTLTFYNMSCTGSCEGDGADFKAWIQEEVCGFWGCNWYDLTSKRVIRSDGGWQQVTWTATPRDEDNRLRIRLGNHWPGTNTKRGTVRNY